MRKGQRKYASAEIHRQVRNAQRRLARAADPTYKARAQKYQRTYDQKNKERERARKIAWMKANPQQKKVNRQRRRALKRDARGHHSAADLRALLRHQHGHCAYCWAPAEHVDHAIPLARGGSNWPWNLQWLCAWHNISKGDSTDAEYREKIGRLPGAWPGAQLWSAALLLPMWALA